MFEELTAPLFTTEWGRRAGIGILIVTCCLLLYTCINMFFSWHADYQLAHMQKSSASTHPPENTSQLIGQIPDWHLFGKYGAVAAGLPVTSLQLRLVGVIKADPAKYSRVIIAEGDQPGKVYQVGDTLSSGARVNSITDEGVVLENGDSLEKLPLDRSGLDFQGKPKPLLNPDSTEE